MVGLLFGWRWLKDCSNWSLLGHVFEIADFFVKFFDFFFGKMKLELLLSDLLVQSFNIGSKLSDLIGIVLELILFFMQTLLNLLQFLLVLHF